MMCQFIVSLIPDIVYHYIFDLAIVTAEFKHYRAGKQLLSKTKHTVQTYS